MADYYNRDGALRTATGARGASLTFGPKKTTTVEAVQDGSASIRALVDRGILVPRGASALTEVLPRPALQSIHDMPPLPGEQRMLTEVLPRPAAPVVTEDAETSPPGDAGPPSVGSSGSPETPRRPRRHQQ